MAARSKSRGHIVRLMYNVDSIKGDRSNVQFKSGSSFFQSSFNIREPLLSACSQSGVQMITVQTLGTKKLGKIACFDDRDVIKVSICSQEHAP